ncbi:O-antigen ligase family protein [Rhizomicrobium electricum]|uniref:O-antigen ligase family protein n=1 Tax=Rhizomicrobium electricum TaxID=480070 RepID=UPI0014220B46|nr:O-antigen ligase family protein [Rhizomicrobium electricum]NIJ47880.1 O-antigen ligase [Rhizomicrobium electricum]
MLVSLQVVLAQYVRLGKVIGSALLARHLLIFFAVACVMGSVSLFSGGSLTSRISPTSSLTHPNLMASILGLGLLHASQVDRNHIFARGDMIAVWSKWSILTMGVLLFAILYARGAAIALFFALSAFVIRSTLRGSGLAIVALFSIVVGGTALWYSGEAVEIVLRGNDVGTLMTFTGRTVIWQAALEALHGVRLVLGFGYAISFPTYSLAWSYGSVFGLHNSYLQTFASGGVLGAILFILFLGSEFASAFRALTRSREMVGVQYMSAVMFLAVNCFSESLFGANLSTPFAVFLCFQTWFALRKQWGRTIHITNRRGRRPEVSSVVEVPGATEKGSVTVR